MPQDIKSAKRDDCQPQEDHELDVVGLLTPKHIAKKLNVSDAMVYKMVREGKLGAVHIGRLVRIKPESYARLLEERTTKAR